MKCRDIWQIDVSKSEARPHKPYKTQKNIIGLDTETEKGKAFILGAAFPDGYEVKSIDTFEDAADILTDWRLQKSTNFFYNIDYDFTAIIKHLPIKYIKELARREKTQYEDYEIKYIPEKFFSIGKERWRESKFFDLMQFYNFMSLNNAGSRYLGIRKEDLKEEGIDISQLSAKRYDEDAEYKVILDSYLKRDCEITQKLGVKLQSLVKPYLIPKNYYSQASFSQQYYLEHLDKNHKLPSLEVLDYALRCYQGGRFEVFRRGYVKNTYTYDIKSAYPYMNVNVPDLNEGRWEHVKEYDPDALIAIYKCHARIDDCRISPLKYQIKGGLMLYPSGEVGEVYLNQKEYESVSGDADVRIIDGWAYHDNNPEYPYMFLKDFYDLKEKLKKEGNDELAMIPKIIINGFYGKMIQVNEERYYSSSKLVDQEPSDMFELKGELIYEYKKFKAGKIFNPIVANEITANTRVKLYEDSKRWQKDILGFQTDSIMSSRPLDLDLSNQLGSWEIEKKEKDMLLIGSGVYQVIDDLKPKVRMRGFHPSLDLRSMLQHGDLKVSSNHANKLKSSMRGAICDEDKYSMLNLIVPGEKTININFDRKRQWEREFAGCSDALESSIDSTAIYIR